MLHALDPCYRVEPRTVSLEALFFIIFFRMFIMWNIMTVVYVYVYIFRFITGCKHYYGLSQNVNIYYGNHLNLGYLDYAWIYWRYFITKAMPLYIHNYMDTLCILLCNIISNILSE